MKAVRYPRSALTCRGAINASSHAPAPFFLSTPFARRRSRAPRLVTFHREAGSDVASTSIATTNQSVNTINHWRACAIKADLV